MIALLNYFGITPNQLGSVFIVVAIFAWAEWKFFLRDINDPLSVIFTVAAWTVRDKYKRYKEGENR
jgi:hypothetical protein